jgi:CubicO group peptidase (beta-lactamase class C family)
MSTAATTSWDFEAAPASSGHEARRGSAMKPNRNFHSILLAAALACAGACVAQAPAERMAQVVQPYSDAHVFMGSVLVGKHGKVIFSKGYGMANLEWNIPNSPTTKFNIASMTKQFTAASILLLEDRGKLKTEDPIRKYFPETPASWDKITIYNLLTHTSGISDDAATYVPGTPDKLIFHDKPLNFQPGEQWSYVNMGFLMLGYLVEKLSGQTYAGFVHDNIFKPLGMNDSGMTSNVDITPHRATGYWPGDNGIENAERPDPRMGFASGSLYSTTEDLLRWEEGLFGGKLLSPASLRKMTMPFRNDYACGLFAKRVNGHLTIEHNGNNIGFNADMAYYPEEGLAVIVLANLNGNKFMSKIATALAAVAEGEPVPPQDVPHEIALPKTVLARYVGTYQFSDGPTEIALAGNHLIARFPDGATVTFVPQAEAKFFSKVWDIQLEFSQNDKGDFKFLTRHLDGKEDKGTKR